MSRQDEIGFWRRFRGLLEKQLLQFLFGHRGRGHGSPLRADGAAEGVAKRVAGILRSGQCGRGDLRVGRRISASVGVFHVSCPQIDRYLCGVAAY